MRPIAGLARVCCGAAAARIVRSAASSFRRRCGRQCRARSSTGRPGQPSACTAGNPASRPDRAGPRPPGRMLPELSPFQVTGWPPWPYSSARYSASSAWFFSLSLRPASDRATDQPAAHRLDDRRLDRHSAEGSTYRPRLRGRPAILGGAARRQREQRGDQRRLVAILITGFLLWAKDCCDYWSDFDIRIPPDITHTCECQIQSSTRIIRLLVVL